MSLTKMGASGPGMKPPLVSFNFVSASVKTIKASNTNAMESRDIV
jgi:hypothetical protein